MCAESIRVGGQAVIEGVMMRAPRILAVAVRRANGDITCKADSCSSAADRIPLLKKPLIRGGVVLFESLLHGFRALQYSAEQTMEDEGLEHGAQGKTILLGTMAFALVLGLGLFVALPHVLTYWAGTHTAIRFAEDSFTFHLVDGAIKLGVFLAYVKGISLFRDVRRVFEYHGAEHQAILTYEHGEELSVDNARRHPTLHPRCGTSFLLLVLLVSILLFSLLLPLAPITGQVGWGLRNLWFIGIKILLLLPVAGLAYEAVRLGADHMDRVPIRILMGPGLWLQKMTTRPPTDDQREVALIALKRALAGES